MLQDTNWASIRCHAVYETNSKLCSDISYLAEIDKGSGLPEKE